MRETEITVQVFEDLDVIFTKLKRLGFEQVRQCQLNDWYYTHLPTDTEIAYPTLLKNSFLVRQVIDSDTEKAYLCYKDKEIDQKGNVVSEEKIKVEISNLADTLKIFAKAGINCWCELQQTMYVFRQEKIEFAVQAVKDLGNFIEYEEDETISGMNTQQKMDYMSAQLKNLQLNLGTDLSCKKVYLKYLHERNK